MKKLVLAARVAILVQLVLSGDDWTLKLFSSFELSYQARSIVSGPEASALRPLGAFGGVVDDPVRKPAI